MAEAYQRTDWDVADYQIYCLDEALMDRQTDTPLLLRGPKPESLDKGNYFVCMGAAQTFGRFCKKPYPILLQERLGIPALNISRGGAGPSFFSKDNEKLLDYCNNARFVVVQVLSGRSESNSLFKSKGLGTYVRRSDGTSISCDEAFKELLGNYDISYARQIVAETRANWVEHYKELLESIQAHTILFWFSTRKPTYRENYRDVYKLFGEYPQLVTLEMVDQVKPYSNQYVECTSKRGISHRLINRFTGQPTTVKDEWGGGVWKRNWYYPSPEMHQIAARKLSKVCQIYSKGYTNLTQNLSTNSQHKIIFKRLVEKLYKQ